MKIGIAGPISLDDIKHLVQNSEKVPEGSNTPVNALIVLELIKRGHEVSVFTYTFGLAKPKVYVGNNLRLHVGCARLRTFKKILSLSSIEINGLKKAMAEDRCDIIHAHWTYEFAFAALVSGQPCLVTAKDAPIRVIKYFPLFRFIPHPYRLYCLALTFRVLQKCTHLTAVSPYLADHFKRYLKYKRKIEVVPNGLPKHLLPTFPKVCRQKPNITYVSVLTGWSCCKNGGTLLKAFKLVLKTLPFARLIMLGSGHGKDERAYLWAKKHGLTEGVEFAGQVPHAQVLSRLTKEADILVHPSMEESFCMAVLEGMGVGIPVIGGSKSGAVPWLLDYGKAGLLTNVKSKKNLANAMISLANDGHKRKTFAKAGWQRVQDNFLIENVVDKYIEMYKRIIKK